MLNKKLLKDITEYCKLNDLVIEDYINKLLRDAFTIDKYGSTPQITKEKVIKKETIKEEKPKEVIIKKSNDLYGEE